MGEVSYHCGGHVFLEANCKSSGWDFKGSDLIGECVYASDTTCGVKVGDIILPNNLLCGGCAGNADRFDASDGFWGFVGHGFFYDEGGPAVDAGRHEAASGWHRFHPNEPVPPGIGSGFAIDLLRNFGY
jgi:hypothetical protein